MKFQFLPHYFKYIGLVLFALFTIPYFLYDFYLGFTGQSMQTEGPIFLPSEIVSPLGHLGLLVYILAKDRIFDEYMIKLRMESAFITVVVTLLLINFLQILKGSWVVNASYFFELQVFSFLIIHAIRKRL